MKIIETNLLFYLVESKGQFQLYLRSGSLHEMSEAEVHDPQSLLSS